MRNLNKGCLKNNKAITLITLIVTIIILLILAAVSLNMIMGDSGIFIKAKNASEETNRSQVLEELRLKALELQTEQNEKTTIKQFLEYLKSAQYNYVLYDENGTLIENISEISDTAEQVYIGYKGYKFKIDNKLIITFMEKIEQNDEKIKYDKISDWSAKNIELKYRALKALNSKNENYNLKLYNIYSSNKSGYFNGEDSYGEVKLNNAIKYNNTINYVIKPDQSVTNCCVFSDYSSDECLILDIEGDLLHIYCSFDYSNYYIIPKSDLYDGNIKYLTVVYGENAKEHQLYINGKPIEKTEDTQYWVISSTEYTNIGCRNRSGTMLYYKGEIYEITIYNHSLNQEEVETLYNEKIN